MTPGQHTLTIVLASNTYVPMMDTAQAIKIDFEPAQPLPLPVADDRGAPAVKLASLIDGSTVPPSFPVQVQAINFTATAALEGKADVVGYGHFHVWVDAPDKPTSLANLVLMPGTNAFTLDLSAWGPGKHTIRIEAAKNDHTKYDPSTPVTFTVNVSASAAPAASPAAASPAATTPPQGLATAAASPPAAGAAQGQASLELVDIAFKPTEFTIAANQNVVVTLKNTGATAHNFSVTDHNNPKVKNLNISVNVAPGATQTVTINAPAGDYYFFCNVPGHEAAGMLGTMHVK